MTLFITTSLTSRKKAAHSLGDIRDLPARSSPVPTFSLPENSFPIASYIVIAFIMTERPKLPSKIVATSSTPIVLYRNFNR
jgi:hypothetical protein